MDLARFIVGEVDHDSIRGLSVPPSDEPNTVGHLGCLPSSVANTEHKLPAEQRMPRCTAVNWRFKNGAIGNLLHGLLMQGDDYDARLEILCDGLRVRVEKPYSAKPRLHIMRGKESEQVVEFPDDDPYLNEDTEFINAVRAHLDGKTSKPVQCTYSDGVSTYALTYKIREVTTAGNTGN